MTVYRLGQQALRHTNLYFEQIEGDTRQVECVDMSGDPLISDIPPSASATFRWGRAVKTEHLPKKLRPKGPQKRMPDFALVAMGQIASAAFREVAEALEPGVHQFEPVTVVDKRGETLAEMFWFVPCQRLDTLAVDLLVPPLESSGKYYPLANEIRIVFDAAKVGDAAIWCDARFTGTLFASDRFKDAAEAAGLTGLDFKPYETVGETPAVEVRQND